MILSRSTRGVSLRRGLAAALALAALPGVVSANPAQTFYERSFVLAAGARCNLFDARLTAALNAATLQARGAALRAGTSEADLSATRARAHARAHATPCGSADLNVVRGRVQTGFAGWQRTRSMTFPGDRADWTADRAAYSRTTWRLMQATTTGASPVRFGVAGGMAQPDVLTAVVSWYGRPRPTGARIVLRDTTIAPRPWLSGTTPPAPQTRVIWAAANQSAPASLLAASRTEGQAWSFPDSAAQALAGLDPREVFAVEFVFRDGSVARAQFEAGDFPAARAFVAMGPV